MRRHFAQGTSVGVEKSRAEIDRILSKVGATQRAVGHDDEQDKMWEQACRERWRVLTLLLKAKLEAIELGLSTVEREFLADIFLPDGRTVHEALVEQIERAYTTGKMPPLLGSGK